MCGIAGIVNLTGKPLDIRNGIVNMSSAIKHRGPDDEGLLFFSGNQITPAFTDNTSLETRQAALPYTPKTYFKEINENFPAAFAHRRLSIIDLGATGHQPMCNKQENIWITFNGEIYNYIELRKELNNLGFQFISNSDTEVVINAYKAWGEECVNKFNGMWAFVILDKNKNILFGSRDRLGVKPLYYYHNKYLFMFGSEHKAILNSGFAKTKINSEAAFDFFVNGAIETKEEGLFSNILELFPSHNFTLNLSNGQLKKYRYYTLTANSRYESYNAEIEKKISQELSEKLIEAIKLRLRSDVTVGTCLSGGIDSSIITGIITHLIKQGNNLPIKEKLETFTATFNDKQIDESIWAKLVADFNGVNWNTTQPNIEHLITDLNELIYSQDIPIWSTSTYAQHSVMKLVKANGIKVVLDGQGGDELFAGYDIYNVGYLNELLKNRQYSTFVSNLKLFGTRAYLKQKIKSGIINILPAGTRYNIQKQFINELKYLSPNLVSQQSHLLNKHQNFSSLNETLQHDLYNNKLKSYLKCEDRCSMWHSVEARTPFADDINLIEYALQIPSTYKLHHNISKHILREAGSKFIPTQIKNRSDKKGYTTPNSQWVFGLKEHVRELFTNELNDFIDVKRLLKDYDQLFADNGQTDNIRIFRFISFAKWKQLYNL